MYGGLRLRANAVVSESELALVDGARVAVIGGGPAGSFFAYFLLRSADMIGLRVAVDIYEPRSFDRCGPAGCNHCGGIVSESLVQILATDGINLPPEVAQRGIASYVVHTDVGSVEIASPVGERRIAALYRGNGPRTGEGMPWQGFDGFVQKQALDRGARLVRKLITGMAWRSGLPHILEADGTAHPYELVCVATGVNSNFLASLAHSGIQVGLPATTRTFICEFRCGAEEIARTLGDSMHVFLLDLPRLEFAALIPKGEFVTLCMLGRDLDRELVQSFLASPEVREVFPVDAAPCVCSCSPLINVRGTQQPFADRLVLVGDSGVTRLYKDGIGAAYRTAKAAATTAVFEGISTGAFRRHYWPVCRAISRDNAIGGVLFKVSEVFKHVRVTRRALLRMTGREQEGAPGPRRMSGVLWNMFTGSAPYREILVSGLHPGFARDLLWNVVLSLWPDRKQGRTHIA